MNRSRTFTKTQPRGKKVVMKTLVLVLGLLNLIIIIGLIVAAKRLERHIRKIIKAIWSLADNFRSKTEELEQEIEKLKSGAKLENPLKTPREKVEIEQAIFEEPAKEAEAVLK